MQKIARRFLVVLSLRAVFAKQSITISRRVRYAEIASSRSPLSLRPLLAMTPELLLLMIVLIGFSIGCARAGVRTTPPPTEEQLNPWRVVVEPDAGSAPLLTLLNGAQKSIRLQTFLLTEKEWIDALKAARGRGVDVRVMLEVQPLAGVPGNRPALNTLQAANVATKPTNVTYKLSHAKFFVIDDRLAVVMTFDQTRVGMAESRGFAILDTDPDEVAEIIAVFEADWKRARVSPSDPNLVLSPFNARQRLYGLIDDAKQSLDIECEQVRDDELETHLAAALQRGVAVRIVTSPMPGNDALAGWQETLAQMGAKFRLVKIPPIYGTLIIADNTRAFVGSTRLVTAALDSYRDLGIVVGDSAARTLSATFASDWNIGR